MSIAVADLLALDEPADFKRDRWDRPLIVPAEGGKAKPYTRCSSAAKAIEDTFGLEMWARRNVAFGMAHDASLVARVLALGGTPYTWGKDEKSTVGKIVAAAEQVAQAHKGADIGTAVHRLTERLDHGEEVQAGPYQADLDAYAATMAAAGFRTAEQWIECRIVCDELEMAGTADRIVERDGTHYIADLKTGTSVDFGGLGYAAQLAAYAHGHLYDPATDTRVDTPTMDLERGLIIHLPAGTGTCTLYWVDLAAGYEAARLANEVRTVRKAAKSWLRPVEIDLAPTLEASLPVPPERIEAESAALRVRLNAAVEAGARRMVWPDGVAKFRDGGPSTWAQLLEVERCVLDAEGEAQMPFAEKLPDDPTRPALHVVAPLAWESPIVEGGVAATPTAARPALDVLDRLKAMHDALPTDLQQAAFGACMAAGVSSDRRTWTIDEIPTVERILASATSQHDSRQRRIAQIVDDVDNNVALVVVQAITDTPTQPKNLPATLESLTGDEVHCLELVVDALGTALGVSLDTPDEMRLVVLDLAEQHVLDAFAGSKAEALAAAKELAQLHGRPKPRSVAQACTDPVLIALLLAAS